jgi:hypothetical protein
MSGSMNNYSNDYYQAASPLQYNPKMKSQPYSEKQFGKKGIHINYDPETNQKNVFMRKLNNKRIESNGLFS